jgi:cytochrome c553
MRLLFRRLFFLGCFATVFAAAVRAHPLLWDAMEKSRTAQPGGPTAELDFVVKNTSDQPVEITRVLTSCHCTTAPAPRTPWLIAPGASDTLHVTVDLTGRRGGLTKTIYVGTSAGEQQLLVHVDIPPPPAARREMNLMVAQADRQAVLRGDCATCHVAPTVGRHGAALYGTACEICHTTDDRRATMVPDLAKPTVARDAAYWRRWIEEGRDGTLMPAFGRKHGGPLDDDQIDSLVAYVLATLPTEPVSQ